MNPALGVGYNTFMCDTYASPSVTCNRSFHVYQHVTSFSHTHGAVDWLAKEPHPLAITSKTMFEPTNCSTGLKTQMF